MVLTWAPQWPDCLFTLTFPVLRAVSVHVQMSVHAQSRLYWGQWSSGIHDVLHGIHEKWCRWGNGDRGPNSLSGLPLCITWIDLCVPWVPWELENWGNKLWSRQLFPSCTDHSGWLLHPLTHVITSSSAGLTFAPASVPSQSLQRPSHFAPSTAILPCAFQSGFSCLLSLGKTLGSLH